MDDTPVDTFRGLTKVKRSKRNGEQVGSVFVM